MDTIEKIEKRRREIRYINYVLIYLLTMTVFGLFFFIDEITGFVGALKYNIMLRLYFISFVGAVIFYLAQKEKQQAALTRKLLKDIQGTSEELEKEVRNKEFLSTISFMISNLHENTVLEKLFNVTRQFFEADGGAVILKGENLNWGDPLITFPENTDVDLLKKITRMIDKTGRSLIQPEAGIEQHQPIKAVKNLIAVPLRLEGRLWGVIALWSDDKVNLGQSELDVLEVIACEASNSALTMELLKERKELLQGLLRLVSKAVDERTSASDRTAKIAEQARALAHQMELPPTTINAVEVAAMLKDVHYLVSNGGKNGGDGGESAEILKSMSFPKSITQLLASDAGTNKPLPLGSRIIDVAEAYVKKAFPRRGRKPALKTVMSKLKADSHDKKVLEALERALMQPDVQAAKQET